MAAKNRVKHLTGHYAQNRMCHSVFLQQELFESQNRRLDIRLEGLFVKGSLLFGNNGGTYGITGDIDSGTQHI